MIILGISAFYHDSAACILKDGEILAAAQEERFTRIRHDSSFPYEAINFCLTSNNLKSNQIDQVVFYDKPFLKFERLLETYLAFAPKGFTSFLKSMPLWLKDKLFQKRNLINHLIKLDNSVQWDKKLLFSEHHLSHAASAFYPSPFKKAAILTMDGVGEWTTTSIASGNDKDITILEEINFPHSLGLLYSAFTYYLGFKVNSGEYKMMGLAPYGKPIYLDLIKDHLIEIKKDGSYRLNMDYFNYPAGLTMTHDKFHNLFQAKPRQADEPIEEFHMNLASSIQALINEVVIKIITHIKKITQLENLCLAGGVALNCVTNGEILKTGLFKNVWIQPAAGDAGGALGAALATYYLGFNGKRIINPNDSMRGAFLGPDFTQKHIENILKQQKAKFKVYSEQKIISLTAKYLAEGKAIGWFNGKMEFGPRALGNRSIIADARSPKMQKNLNLKIKFRESFRPFAPSILEEDLQKWFDLNSISPYMLLVARVKKDKLKKYKQHLTGFKQLSEIKSLIPAVTHVDLSARIQTVNKKTNPRYYKLIEEFKKLTGCPLIINTSFNIRGEPIVHSPAEALRCFYETSLDALVLGNCILIKEDQTININPNYKKQYLND